MCSWMALSVQLDGSVSAVGWHCQCSCMALSVQLYGSVSAVGWQCQCNCMAVSAQLYGSVSAVVWQCQRSWWQYQRCYSDRHVLKTLQLPLIRRENLILLINDLINFPTTNSFGRIENEAINHGFSIYLRNSYNGQHISNIRAAYEQNKQCEAVTTENISWYDISGIWSFSIICYWRKVVVFVGVRLERMNCLETADIFLKIT